jgi:hypothetical protein
MNDDTRILRGVGLLTARVILGLIFGMAGYWKTFELTPVGHARKLFIGPYADTWIPMWMLWATGTVIPVVELVAGWLLVAGWRVREALIALATSCPLTPGCQRAPQSSSDSGKRHLARRW